MYMTRVYSHKAITIHTKTIFINQWKKKLRVNLKYLKCVTMLNK